MGEADSKDRLEIGCRSPVKVLNLLAETVILLATMGHCLRYCNALVDLG